MRIRRIVILLLALFLAACGSYVERRINSGNEAYHDEDFTTALRAYQDAQVAAPDEADAYFNAAAAYARAGELDRAIAALEQAIVSGDEMIAANAYYNLGNLQYAVGAFDLAIDAYQQALIRNPEDEDARHNLELALLRAVDVTPTAQEQQTSPDQGETDPTTTPTDQPGGFDGPTPSPPPFDFDLTATPVGGEDSTDNLGTGTPTPQPDGEMTVEQALQLLDRVQQDQQALSEFLDRAGSPGASADRDW